MASWSVEGVQSTYGAAVSGAGDVNGDGFSDVVVGAYLHANGAGQVYVYHGSVNGLSDSPSWTVSGPQGGAYGFAVATAGDVNGDGYSDLIVGAPVYDNGRRTKERCSSTTARSMAWAARPGR
jgi:hypothetical protein